MILQVKRETIMNIGNSRKEVLFSMLHLLLLIFQHRHQLEQQDETVVQYKAIIDRTAQPVNHSLLRLSFSYITKKMKTEIKEEKVQT